MKTLLGTLLTRRDVMRAAWRIRREDRLTMGPALRRAWAWARRKGEAAFSHAVKLGATLARPAAQPARDQKWFNPRATRPAFRRPWLRLLRHGALT